MKIFASIILLTLCLEAFSDGLKKSTDNDLAHILATMDVLYKNDVYPFVEIIQSWEQISECDGTWQSCPNARLFILTTLEHANVSVESRNEWAF